MINSIVDFIRDQFATKDFIPLHAPIFSGNERKFVLETIDSTFVSSVGAYVDKFEQEISAYTKSPSAVATMNGTSALHMALLLAGVTHKDYVLTQAITFVATGNAIRYCDAEPIFIDVEKNNLGLCPRAVNFWLEEFAFIDDNGLCRYKKDNRIIRACLPMHTFGHPVDMESLLDVCRQWNLTIVEDAAEALGSFYKEHHVGTLGLLGILSFNGNKIITTGGGGMILTNQHLGKRAKHLTTTAKQPHAYEFYHDEIGYNYRLPNINAALGCAQLEQLNAFLKIKRQLAQAYESFFANSSIKFISEPKNCHSNYWLNAVCCADKNQRDELIAQTNAANIMTRPIWNTLNTLPMFKHAPQGRLENTTWLAERVLNLPSGVMAGELNA